ncbi:hypothetical protein AMJ40_05040 [candidate division TA06 bacterium DG_26]|uniref:Uncharacterized protein n=1 Tax=candidate division TA06 bacterium DG_26 TaxID=1703771 RepID=A0A0S7WHP2_UNCT6|nr:MAG: hypothetical protein AMJ40_05040 [candidate division TA06 bacterium DG_26]
MKVEKSAVLSKIFESPEEIESGLRMLDKDVKIADHGPIDLVAMDGAKRLVVIQVGLDDSPQILADAIDRYDWIVRNEHLVHRLYGSSGVDLSERPRVFVLIPHLAERLLRISSYFCGLKLEVFEYKYVPSLDGLVAEKIPTGPQPAATRQETTTHMTPLYVRLREMLRQAFDRLEIFEIGPISLVTLDDRIVSKVSFTEDFLIIEMPPDGVLEIKDESGLENVVSVLRTRVEKFEVESQDSPGRRLPPWPSLTEQELEALGAVEDEKKEKDAPDQTEAETE